MNILWIYNYPLVPEAGGTERMTQLIANGLASDGHKCLGILLITEDGHYRYNNTEVQDLYRFLKDNDIDFVINQLGNGTWLLERFLNKGGAQWHAEGGKIVTCLHFDTKEMPHLYFLRSRRAEKHVNFLKLAKAFLFSGYYQRKNDRLVGCKYRYLYQRSDWFITLSERFNPYFMKVTGLDCYPKLKTIGNPLTFDTISDHSIIAEKRKTILVCSRMEEVQKRVSLALKAWKKLQKHSEAAKWELKIIGTGPDLDNYKKLATALGLQRVTFYGQQNPEPFYSEASVFMMTSAYEGWGLTLTESIQRGVVPVVMNTCSVFSDIITDGYNGYLTKPCLKDFVAHIRKLMSDKSMLETMQFNALKSAERFTLDATMKKWREIIPSANF